MDGKFTVESGRMVGSYKERSFTYEVLQIEKENGETINEDEKENINEGDLREADKIMFKVTGSDDDEYYRWIGGPFPDEEGLEDAITDWVIYGTP